jgi:energy-coupling factor transport system permease protein
MNLLLPGMYIADDTVVHRLDPRVKMCAATLLMVLPFAAPSLQSNLILSAFVLTLVALSGVPVLAVLSTLRTVFWLGFLMFFFYAFTTPGPPLVTWGPISITSAGVLAGGAQIYRLCQLVIIASLLSYTTSPTQLAHGLESLLYPLARLGLPVPELALVLTIALRFVPTLSQEIDKLAKAQRARGIDPGGAPGLLSAWNRIKSWVPMFVPIFVSAFRRAEHLATAMEARGFRGARHRTRLVQLKLRRRDLAAAGIVLLVTFATWAATHLSDIRLSSDGPFSVGLWSAIDREGSLCYWQSTSETQTSRLAYTNGQEMSTRAGGQIIGAFVQCPTKCRTSMACSFAACCTTTDYK